MRDLLGAQQALRHESRGRVGIRFGQIDSQALIVVSIIISTGMIASAWISADRRGDSRASSETPSASSSQAGGVGQGVNQASTPFGRSVPDRVSESDARSVDALYARVASADFRPVGFVEDESSAPAAEALAERRNFRPVPSGSSVLSAIESIAAVCGVPLSLAPAVSDSLRQCTTTDEVRPSTGWDAVASLLQQVRKQGCVYPGVESADWQADLEGGALTLVPASGGPRVTVVYDVLDLCLPKQGVCWVPARDSEVFWDALGEHTDSLIQRVFDAIDAGWAGTGEGSDLIQHLPEGQFEVRASRPTHRALQRYLGYLRSVNAQLVPSRAR